MDSVDKMGCTALHIAALYGHDLLSNTLLNYGADASKPGFKGYCNKKSCLSKSSIAPHTFKISFPLLQVDNALD